MKAVTITGGGLAGLSLGIALRENGIPVTLHEAGRYPRHRVCGEFIAGVSESTLRRLGINDILEQSLSLERTAWYLKDQCVLRRDLPRRAWGISRWSLDDALARHFEDLGGTLLTGSRQSLSGKAGPGQVRATGRVPEGRRSGWIGLKIHLRDIQLKEDLELHLGNHGYAGISRVEEGAWNLCGLFRMDSSRKGHGSELLAEYLNSAGLTRMLSLLTSSEPDEDSFSAVSGMNYRLFSRGAPGFSLGDTWSLIPPFTGNGMSLAFESASWAVDPLRNWSSGQSDWQSAIGQYRSALRKNLLPRVLRARILHALLLLPKSRNLLGWLAREDYLPFRTLYGMTH